MRVRRLRVAACLAALACAPGPAKDADGHDTDVPDTDVADTDTPDTLDADDTDPGDTDGDTDGAAPAPLDLTPSRAWPAEPLWVLGREVLQDTQERLQAEIDAVGAAQVAARAAGLNCGEPAVAWRGGVAHASLQAAADATSDDPVVLLCPGTWPRPTLLTVGQHVVLGPASWGAEVVLHHPSGGGAGALAAAARLTLVDLSLRQEDNRGIWRPEDDSQLALVDVDMTASREGGLLEAVPVGEVVIVRSTIGTGRGSTVDAEARRLVVAQNRWVLGAASTGGLLGGASSTWGHGVAILVDNVFDETVAGMSVVRWGRAQREGSFVSIANRWSRAVSSTAGGMLTLGGSGLRAGLFGDSFEGDEAAGTAMIAVTSDRLPSSLRMVDVTVTGNGPTRALLRLTGDTDAPSAASLAGGRWTANQSVEPAIVVEAGWTLQLDDVVFGAGADANTGGDVAGCPPLAGVARARATDADCQVEAP
ncbi:MAG: hypothetical protein H6733_10930 [Alphaproteobacteria bacterium]|nr:hypothetical protein [Alphaproteobacteria bacterium]